MRPDLPVLVTGGSGFIGAALCQALSSLGVHVHVATSGQTPPDRLASLVGRIDQHAVDLTDDVKVNRLIAVVRPQIVFHLASYGVAPDQADVERLFCVNVLGTQHLLHACEAVKPLAIVTVGSWTEYGPSQRDSGEMCETDATVPSSNYGIAKLAATLLARAWSRRHDVPLTILRLASVYGPGEEPHRLMSLLRCSLQTNEAATLGNPNAVRDFIHLDDVVKALVSAAEPSDRRGMVINIGSGVGRSLRQLVEAIQATGAPLPTPAWQQAAPRPWDVPVAIVNRHLAQQELHWAPTQDVVSWFTSCAV